MGQYTPELRRQPTTSSSTTETSSSTSVNQQSRNQQIQPPRFESVNRSSDESQPSSSSFGSTSSDASDSWRRVKCVLVGDAAVGKTSLIVSYTTDGYPHEYVPTAFDNYSVLVRVDGQPVKVQLCDTAGQEDFDSLRVLCYPNTDVFILCFSVVNPDSFHNIGQWLQKVRQYAPDTPLLLIGTESDLRTNIKILIDLSRHNRAPISSAQARKLAAEIGAIGYIECSSLTQLNLKEVFDAAILAALKLPNGDDQSRVQVHEFRGRKSFRKWKNKLVTRSTSADSMKHLRIKRSASNNNTKMTIPNAQSIGRLNFHASDSPPVLSTFDPRRHARPSYAAAMCSASPSLCNMKLAARCEQKKFTGATSVSNHSIGKPPAKTGNEIGSDLSKAKKGWKKLLCVV